MRNKSVNIKLPRIITNIKQLDKWDELWNNADDATYTIPSNLTEDEITDYVTLFIAKLPNSFASAVLSEIAEYDDTPWALLEKIFDTGDTSCMVSVCCRPDIPSNIVIKCLSSSNTDVLEHIIFNDKVSNIDCETLVPRRFKWVAGIAC